MTDPEAGMADGKRNMCLKRKKRRLPKSLLKEQFYEFGATTTLHGIRYVTDRRLSVVEKVFWFLIFSVSVGFCLYRISAVWTKWQDSPVLVTVSDQLVPVGSVPFPSVTICPQMKTKASEFNYTAIYEKKLVHNSTHEITSREIQIFEGLLLLCNDKFTASFYSSEYYNIIQENSTVSIIENLLKVAPSIDDVMLGCKWRSEYVLCSKFFKTVITAEGVCFNMNSIQSEEMFHKMNIWSDYKYWETKPYETKRGWDINGYYDPSEKDPYPRRGLVNGAKPELWIQFSEKIIDHDKMCNSLNNGFKVYMQHPDNMPSALLHYYSVTPGKRSSFALKFNILSTADNLKDDVSSETRQCFFPDERPLRHFKIYTASNCNIECLANITYKLCKCVGFHMPRETSTKICTFLDMDCMEYAQEKMAEMQANYIYLKTEDKSEMCNCLPSCNSVDYDADVIGSDFKLKTYLRAVNSKLEDEDLHNMTRGHTFSVLSIYYKQPRYISMRRSELFGMTEFLANCGGLLGLFLGFSFISIVEIIYFITLRLWCTIKRVSGEDKST